MAKYSISYTRPGEPPAIHELEAGSEPAARIRFLNLSWVAFSDISINSIAIAAAQPEEAKAKARKAVTAGVKPHAFRSRFGTGDCIECGQPAGHALHKGFDPTMDWRPSMRSKASDKAEAAAVRMKAAGVEFQPLPNVGAASSKPAGVVIEQPSRQGGKRARAAALGLDPWAEANRLSQEIGDLADKAQALTRAGKHDEADAMRAKAKKLAAIRAEITKRNRK
ncbi:hypothetical protein [Devosia ginsengisoli]|uniref:hypothetical protein n=1 Tax=Devosia ginsengisoli TaxID=400770 RepID=UPI0026F27DEE|nr:hypothetical protein [Devosia ginsengisoli]MCR6673260.1 hypothetical protein [Devosia ginsengisoli]